MTRFPFLAVLWLLTGSGLTAADYTLHTFKKIQLSDQFWSEGATFGDLNRDGHPDIISGPYWYEGPDFQKRHEFYPAKQTFKLKKDDGTETVIPGFEGGLGKNNTYSDNFFAYVYDFNNDGWPDILIYGFPGKDASWYENPGKDGINSNTPWTRHLVFDTVDNESPTWGDITGDGKPEIICMSGGFIGYASPDWSNPTNKWTFHPISPKGGYQRFTHGLGFGDVNGDGRTDILEQNGWWEQPASLAGDPVWKFNKFPFNVGGSQMYVYDVNGDGLPDVITALAAHGYGLAWYEQLKDRDANGEIQFKQHIILNKEPNENKYGVKFSQLHAVDLVDMDGDGIKDIVTGKRFWAHGSHGDAEPDAPAVLYWLKLVRHADKSVDFVPHLIDDNSGIGTQVVAGKINNAKLPDIVVGNKKGTFVFLHETKLVSQEEWEKAQPKAQFTVTDKPLATSQIVARTEDKSGGAAAAVPPNPPIAPGGVLPVGKDGKPLNLDFEDGTLKDWTATGNAFDKQPILGDVVAKRRSDMKSNHAGKYWIGTYEVHQDAAKGTLTSAPFKVTQPWAGFLVGAAPYENTRVELVRADTQEVFFKTTGFDYEKFKAANNATETMTPVAVDLQAQIGKEIFVRVVDQQEGHWAHINFDDFKLYPEKPAFTEAVRSARNSSTPPAAKNLPPADVIKFAGLSPEDAAKDMTLPPGFKAKLFAGEPDVKQPIAFCIDDRGRIWVAEGYTYPRRAPEGQGKDRILVFEDTNGDGTFDKRTVFMEGLNLVSGLEVGFGGVWVGAAPYLMYIPMKDGDEPKPAGEPKILLDGWAYQDTHETLNTFTWGPDGWLYGCHGVFTHSHVGKPGAPGSQRQFINAGVWRYHPTKHKFEVFAEGTSNPWGVDFDEHGQCIIEACVIPHLFHMIQGGRYHRQAGQHYAPSLEEEARILPSYATQDFTQGKLQQPLTPYIYNDIKTIADHFHYVGATPHSGNGRSDSAGGGHAHAGMMVYLGGSWPEKYRGQFFMNNIHGARINMDMPEAKGSGLVGHHGADFINFNDSWSQIINLQYDQDGSVFMIDWYDKNQCHNNNPEIHDRTNGRIFKIVYGDTKMTKVDLQKLSDEELVKLLLNKNEWYVRHARRILQERTRYIMVDGGKSADGKSVKITYVDQDEVEASGPLDHGIIPANRTAIHNALRKILAEDTNPAHQLRALWALQVTKGLVWPNSSTVNTALEQLKNPNEYVRAWAIQFLCEDKNPSAAALEEFARLAKEDPSPVVRLYLAAAMQRTPLDKRMNVLQALVAHGEDVDDHNLPLMYWYAAEPVVGQDTTKAVLLLSKSKIPVLREYITRRMAAGNKVAQAGQ